MARYQMTLEPCDATSQEEWGRVVCEAPSLLALWDSAGWRCGISWEEKLSVVDSKTGKRLTAEEYEDIVKRLKGWDK